MGGFGFRAAATTVAVGVIASGALTFGTASGSPADPIIVGGAVLANSTAPDGSKITATKVNDDRNLTLTVHSAAMDKEFEVEVQRPADTSKPRPTLYLLNGAGGGTDLATWDRNTDATEFFGDKNINVVQPVGGGFTYYADWRAPDPVLGVNKWQTYLTKELPPLIDSALGTSKVNAIAGISTSGTSVLSLAIASPGLYRSVGAYSGCAQISDPAGQAFVKMVVETRGGGKSENMYGQDDDPMWAANDPYVNAAGLRGLNLYISAGGGLPGPYDTQSDPHTLTPDQGGLPQQLVVGGAIEAAVGWCSRNLQGRLNELGIPATYDLEPTGTHSWAYWQRTLKQSWPVISTGLGDLS